MGDERGADQAQVLERGHPLVLALLRRRDPLHSALALAALSWAAVEIVDLLLGQPLEACVRWAAGPNNGNCRVQAAWFFALVGLWLYPALPALAVLSLRRAMRATGVPRLAWIVVALGASGVLGRLLQLQVATGALGLYG